MIGPGRPPPVRWILAAILVGVVVGLLFRLWLGWPGVAAAAAGLVFGSGSLIAAIVFGADVELADAAWREQAGDLRAVTDLPGVASAVAAETLAVASETTETPASTAADCIPLEVGQPERSASGHRSETVEPGQA